MTTSQGPSKLCGHGAPASGPAAALAIIAAIAMISVIAEPALAARRHQAAQAVAEGEESESATAKNTLTGPYQAACLMEPVSGAVIFAKNEHQPWPTASLAKMMLMEVVAEKLDDGSLQLTDRITTSRKAEKMGGSQVYLEEGETFSLNDMMEAVVVHSANDAAVAIAEYIGGSTDAFVQMMNAQAQKLGMKDTHYYSVHGLPPGPGQQADVASAYDEAVLARALVAHPQILKWSGITTTTFRAGKFELRNTNHLVFNYTGCDGLKTGFYYQAGFNVVATARRNGIRFIAAVLGSPKKRENFTAAAELLSQGFAQYEMKSVAKKGAAIRQSVAIKDGALPSLVPVWSDNVAVFMKRGGEKTAYQVQYQVPPAIEAPVKAGQKIGSAEVTAPGQPPETVALVAPSDVPAKKPTLVSRLLDRF